MPKGIEVSFDELKTNIINALKSLVSGELGFKKEPIAFGLNALDISLIATEDNGSKIEGVLRKIKDVQSVNVQSVSLV